jgi:TldD protein
LDLTGNVERWAEEAATKLTATSVQPGTWDLVLHPSHLWLTIHESIAHPTELDRALGYEANYAGTTFLAPPEKVLKSFKLGPELMTVQANRTETGGCATVGWDDEGVAATSYPIVDSGVFVNYQSATRDMVGWTSSITGVKASPGHAYGQDWSAIPFPRMPNVSLLAGRQDLSEEDVIGATKRGIYIEGDGSYSIDQQRYNFQFGGQVFWEIRDGKKTRMLRDAAYVARTPEFWRSMAVIGGSKTYRMGASFGDAKGQPGQSNAVSHGCPIALFRNVSVINTA